MASMPPRKTQSIWLQPKRCPTLMPVMDMKNTVHTAAMTGAKPIFRIFLNEKSRPSEKSRNITPMSAHVCMSALSTTDMVSGKCGDTMKPATIYPSTKGCLRRLKMRVTMLATMSINAKSFTRAGSSAIGMLSFIFSLILCAKLRVINDRANYLSQYLCCRFDLLSFKKCVNFLTASSFMWTS